MRGPRYPRTPDGRYFVSKGRLWRCTDPGLTDAERRPLVKELMRARAGIRTAPEAEIPTLRARVDAAKRALGERGPVWWTDGAEDEGGRHPRNTSYADWWAGLTQEERARGEGRD